jgi:hypothetical protein
MAKQAISPGKWRVLCQGLVNKCLFDGRQRFAFVIGLILVVTAETKLRHYLDQLLIIIGAVWVVTGRATTLLNRTMNGLGAVRHDLVVATDAECFGGELQLPGILRFMCAVTESAKPRTCRGMLIFMLRQVGMTAGTQLTAGRRVSKFVFAGIISNVTYTTRLLIGTTVMRAGAIQQIRVTRGART